MQLTEERFSVIEAHSLYQHGNVRVDYDTTINALLLSVYKTLDLSNLRTERLPWERTIHIGSTHAKECVDLCSQSVAG